MTSVLEPARRGGGAPGGLLRRGVSAVLRRPVVAVAGIVGVSSAVRLVAAWQHALPRFFPDEYLYTALARSIARGELAIRGTPARFPALLEPILTAPFALTGDPELAYRLTQALHAVAMSAAAIPVYLLARRVALPAAHALVAAALAVSLPSLVFAGYVTADAVAYPLVLAAVWAGVRALDHPTGRSQALFLAFATLATFARVQYVVLFAAFLVATLVVGGTAGRRALSAFRLVWVPAVAVSILGVALGPSRLLGYYDGILDLSLPAWSIAHWIAIDAMLLAFASGVVLVPGALAGLVGGLARGRDRAHRAFAALGLALTAMLLAEAGLYAANGSERFQERYLFALVPLVPIAFSVGLRLLPGAGRVTAVAALGLIVVSARSPLTDYTQLSGAQDSPFLQGVAYVAERLEGGSGALVLSAVASALCLVAVGTAFRPRLAPLSIGLAACAVVPMAVFASKWDIERSERMIATYTLAGDPSWVDAAGVSDAAVIVARGAERGNVSSILFWNRSVTDVLAFPRAPGVDAFGTLATRVTASGAVIASGVPVRRPVAVEESFTQMIFDDADLLRRTPTATLWKPRGDLHVAAMFTGRYVDGWLDRVAGLTVWPRADGPRTVTVRFVLSLPAGAPAQTVTIGDGPEAARVDLMPGVARAVALPVTVRARPLDLPIRGATSLMLGDRLVTAQVSRLQLGDPAVRRLASTAGD